MWKVRIGRELRGVGSRPVAAAVLALCLAACGSDSVAPEPGLPTVAPGGTLPLGDLVRIAASGTFNLPEGAASLATRCFGTVTVTFTPPGGSEQNNMCESPNGSSIQTNVVTGVETVDFALGAASFGEVIVQ